VLHVYTIITCLYYVVITRQYNPPIWKSSSPSNEFTSVCSILSYNTI